MNNRYLYTFVGIHNIEHFNVLGGLVGRWIKRGNSVVGFDSIDIGHFIPFFVDEVDRFFKSRNIRFVREEITLD